MLIILEHFLLVNISDTPKDSHGLDLKTTQEKDGSERKRKGLGICFGV